MKALSRKISYLPQLNRLLFFQFGHTLNTAFFLYQTSSVRTKARSFFILHYSKSHAVAEAEPGDEDKGKGRGVTFWEGFPTD